MGITKFILNRLRIFNPFLTVWSSDCTQETEQIIPPLIHRAAPMIPAWPGQMTQHVHAVYQKTPLHTSAANGVLHPASSIQAMRTWFHATTPLQCAPALG